MDNTPPELLCPISCDLMRYPITVTHRGVEYNFERNCFETWKTTPGGDKNPLTMLTGFREAPFTNALELKQRITSFRKEHGIEIDEGIEKIKLEPFSDYQQIQDDEDAARRLNYELNGPPSINTMSSLRWVDSEGYQMRVGLLTDFIVLLSYLSDSPILCDRIVNILMDDIMQGHEIDITSILRRGIVAMVPSPTITVENSVEARFDELSPPEDGPLEPIMDDRQTTINSFGFRFGFLNRIE